MHDEIAAAPKQCINKMDVKKFKKKKKEQEGMQVKMTKITKTRRKKHEKKRKQVQHRFKLSMSCVHCKEGLKKPVSINRSEIKYKV